jgi:hypothetical protein
VAHWKTPLEINFMSSGSKKIYRILRHAAKSVHPPIPPNAIYFIILPFSVQKIHFSPHVAKI